MQWWRRENAPAVCTIHRVSPPGLYHRDYHFRAVHTTGGATAALYCLKSKGEARNNLLELPDSALGQGTINLGTANEQVTITAVGGDPDVTGMTVTLSSAATTSPAWAEGWSWTSAFGWHMTDELLLQFAYEFDQASAGMPFEGWSFTHGPDRVIPKRFPHLVGSFIEQAPIAAASEMYMLSAVVQFRAFVIESAAAAYEKACATLSHIRSLVLDDWRRTPLSPWGRIYHDVQPEGIEEPLLITEGDFRGFSGAVRFRFELEAFSDA